MGKYDLAPFRKGIAGLGISLTEAQEEKYIKYYELLTEWNKVMNLTAVTEFQEVVSRHFLDSLAVVKAGTLEKESGIMDIGTGAGFPGIPLAIIYPEIPVTLLDSLNKRVRFLTEVKEEIGLKNVDILNGRAEDFGKDPVYREKYSLAVSRAVAGLPALSEYCLPFVKRNGRFISYKSGKIQEELQRSEKAVRILGGQIEDTLYYEEEGSGIERSLVIIRKTSGTPAKYPRNAGTPAKKPLS